MPLLLRVVCGQYYDCPLDLRHFDNSRIWVPTGQDYGGLCDRWVSTTSYLTPMLALMCVFPPGGGDLFLWPSDDDSCYACGRVTERHCSTGGRPGPLLQLVGQQ
jgi:hypothetical protein